MSEIYKRYNIFKNGTKKDLLAGKKVRHVEFIDQKTERENNISTDITHNNIKDEDKEIKIKTNESIIIPLQNKNKKKVQLSEGKNIQQKQDEKDIKKKKDKKEKRQTKEKSKEVLELDINDILNTNNNATNGGILITEVLNIGGSKAKNEEEDNEIKEAKPKDPQKAIDNKMITNHENILNEVDEILSKENMKYLNSLKKEEKIIKSYIAKLNDNQKMIENSEVLKKNLAENKMRISYLNNISKTKKELSARLEIIEQKINSILKEEKKRHLKKNLTEVLDDKVQMETIYEDDSNIKIKFRRNKLDKAFNKSKNDLDFEERKLRYYKQKSFYEIKQKEEDLFLKRKNEINANLEKTRNSIEKFKKKDKNYLYFKYKDNFEKQEKLLLESIKNRRKPPLITREELKEYDEKNNQQNQNSESNPEEEKKYYQNMNNYRSQTLPNNREELVKKLKKINIRHNLIKINKSMKKGNSNNKSSKDNLLKTESANRKRVNIFRYSHINSNQKNLDKYYSNINKSLKKKTKLKPIQIFHRKQDESAILKGKSWKRRVIFKKKCKSFHFEDLFEDKNEKGKRNNLKSLDIDNIRTDSFDKKVLKRNNMSMSAAFLTNSYLVNEIGGFLVDSIQEKLNIINSLSLKKDEK